MNIFNVLLYVFTFSLFLYRNNLVESTGSRNFRGFSSGRPPDLKLVTSDGTKESEINSTGFEHRQLGLAGNVHEYNLNEGTRCVKVKQNDTEVWIETDTDTLSTFSSQSTFTDSVNVSEEQSSTSGQPSSVQSTSTETSTDQADGSGGSDPSQRKYPIKIVYNNRAKVMWIIFRDGYLGYMFINGKWIFKISKSISFDNHGTISSAILQSLNSLVTRDSTLLTPELQQSAILTNNLYPTDYSEGNAGSSHDQAGDSTPVDTYIDVPGFGTSSISVPKFFGQNSSISPVRSKPSLKKLPDTEEQPNIKFFTTDDSDPSSTVELSSDKYTVKYYENLKNDYLIELDTDAKCVLVKCEDKEVWKTGEHDLDEPTSSSYYKGYKHVVVRDEDKGVIYNEKKDTWNHYDTKYVSKKPDQSKSKAPSQPEYVPEQQPLTVPESQPTTLPEQPKEETKPVAEPVSGTPEAGQESSQTAGSPHLITVNIDLTESTDQVVYEHDTVNKAQRWTCKEGFLIEKVTKAGNVVWQPKDGRHGDRVVVREAEDGTKGKVYRPGETEGSSSTAQDQQHAKSQQPDASKTEEPTKKSEAAPTHTPTTPAQQSNPKLYTTDPNDNTKFVELATNAYSVVQNGDVTTFTIADSANCTKLTFENVLMWQYDSSKRGGLYPKTLEYNQSSNVLVLKFEGFEITFEKENGNWVYTEADTSKAAKQAQPAKQAQESQQPDASKTEEPVKESEQQTKKSEQQADETKSEQPKESQQPDASKTEEPTKKSEAAPTHTPTTPAQQSNPKLYTTDPNDNTKFVELATNAYSVVQNGDVTTFTIADSANCTKLTFENVLMWQYDSSKRGGLYPKTLDYNQSSNVLVLKFEGFEITFEKENGNWVYTEADTSKAAKQAQPAKKSEEPGKGDDTSELAKEAQEADETKSEQPKESGDKTATLTSGTTDTASVTLTSASQDQTATLTGGSDGSQQAQEAKQAKSEQAKEAEESDATKTEQAKEAEESDATKTEQAKEAEQQAKVYDTSEPAKEAQPAKESDATKTEQAKEAEDGTKTQAPEDQTATLTSGSDGSQQAGEAISDFSTTVISSGFFTSSSKSQEFYLQFPQIVLVSEEAIDNQHKFGINPFGVKPILVSTWS
ncbi:uncharacterized protein TOT_040000835 [Theileria orientalis strain Shintoku]|uniref:SfiI-subtelomeric related protein family member n=1 Tax=Theileria orientalis strain Shintoku TaxID=869250 RepID=J7M8P6_THEOR|nr:uncharacterized protein TOT_040000835 [Theileria orientalis strain Shintoku]BAM42468.1 uncharacterized protein TOT_040000835 [Theileria orientalis strain Shintoku]|eukprot:XP_009692769.1 uncharacterized protein TOT_040000835 [Theileria orientalis strain Shintoku]